MDQWHRRRPVEWIFYKLGCRFISIGCDWNTLNPTHHRVPRQWRRRCITISSLYSAIAYRSNASELEFSMPFNCNQGRMHRDSYSQISSQFGSIKRDWFEWPSWRCGIKTAVMSFFPLLLFQFFFFHSPFSLNACRSVGNNTVNIQSFLSDFFIGVVVAVVVTVIGGGGEFVFECVMRTLLMSASLCHAKKQREMTFGFFILSSRTFAAGGTPSKLTRSHSQINEPLIRSFMAIFTHGFNGRIERIEIRYESFQRHFRIMCVRSRCYLLRGNSLLRVCLNYSIEGVLSERRFRIIRISAPTEATEARSPPTAAPMDTCAGGSATGCSETASKRKASRVIKENENLGIGIEVESGFFGRVHQIWARVETWRTNQSALRRGNAYLIFYAVCRWDAVPNENILSLFYHFQKRRVAKLSNIPSSSSSFRSFFLYYPIGLI